MMLTTITIAHAVRSPQLTAGMRSFANMAQSGSAQ